MGEHCKNGGGLDADSLFGVMLASAVSGPSVGLHLNFS